MHLEGSMISNMGKKKNKENKIEKPIQSFTCKSCGALTFGQPVRMKSLNYCKYCAEREGAS